jgi:hypothetical protein
MTETRFRYACALRVDRPAAIAPLVLESLEVW